MYGHSLTCDLLGDEIRLVSCIQCGIVSAIEDLFPINFFEQIIPPVSNLNFPRNGLYTTLCTGSIKKEYVQMITRNTPHPNTKTIMIQDLQSHSHRLTFFFIQYLRKSMKKDSDWFLLKIWSFFQRYNCINLTEFFVEIQNFEKSMRKKGLLLKKEWTFFQGSPNFITKTF